MNVFRRALREIAAKLIDLAGEPDEVNPPATSVSNESQISERPRELTGRTPLETNATDRQPRRKRRAAGVRASLNGQLRQPSATRDAVVLKEILDKPLGLRRRSTP